MMYDHVQKEMRLPTSGVAKKMALPKEFQEQNLGDGFQQWWRLGEGVIKSRTIAKD